MVLKFLKQGNLHFYFAQGLTNYTKEILREKVQYRLGFLASNHMWALGVCDSCEVVQSDVFVQSCIGLRIKVTSFIRFPKESVTK